ncbi:MAG: hypothetical protein EHM35_03120 [Planctomycetaceae bacterium]|nr:MAG: hypothetical protein EHM35_03120 [Planctomycetaceae bacterium]
MTLRDTDGCGKGYARRPAQIGRAEADLRWALAQGRITRRAFTCRYNKLLREGKITRSGRAVRV